MLFIGDVHGAFDIYTAIVRGTMASGAADDVEYSIQVGDMGIFRDDDMNRLEGLAPNHRFIRGNHDNPELCRRMPSFMGEAGFMPEIDLFWVSGGFSLDRDMRTVGVDWWEDEELSYDELSELIARFIACRPRYVVTHECPSSAKSHLVRCSPHAHTISRTERALQAMWEGHQPEVWVFGHHHRRVDGTLLSTRFVGLGEMRHSRLEDCLFELPELKWPV